MKLIDLKGKKFGRLTVVQREEEQGKEVKWVCICDCGNVVSIIGNNLKRGTTRSCGCLHREITTSHGMSKSSEYNIWSGMKSRCNNRKDPRYYDYGGRGITVCDRWSSFENFYADMGERPAGTSIDRINNDAGYSPENCRWATSKEQSENRRPKSFMDHAMSNNKTSGAVGVWHDRKRERFMVTLFGKYIGQRKSLAEAIVLRHNAELEWEKTT